MSERPENSQARFRPAGDSGLIVEFGDSLDERINNAVLAFDARLRAEAIEGVGETAPTIASVLIRFDPLALSLDRLQERLQVLLEEGDWLSAPPPSGRRRWRIPALYGGEAGPDLAETADFAGVSEETLIREHAEAPQRVLMLGFAPGFAYLGRLPERWDLPRLTKPKPQVPPGSISVAVRQTTFTATTIPTGWRTIACSPFHAFDLAQDPAFLLEPGDEITFEPVSEAEYRQLRSRAEAGELIAGKEVLE